MNNLNIAFFPFTFISEKLAGACHARFGRVAVYQPAAGNTPASMQNLEAGGRIALKYPVKGDDQRLADLARHFQSWGEVHQKDAAVLKKFAESGFFSREFAPEISTEILKGPKETEPEPDPVFNARLFLLLAQEHDRQTFEIENDLALTDDAARKMFAGIRGRTDDSPGFSDDFGYSAGPLAADPGAYMTESRLRAWKYLMGADQEPPSVLVTPSRAVIESMQERFENMERLDSPPEGLQGVLSAEGRKTDGFSLDFYKTGDCGRITVLIDRS